MGRRSRLVGVAIISTIPVAASAASTAFVTAGIATAISMFWVFCAAEVDRMWRLLPDAFVVLAVLPTAMAAAVLTFQGSTTAITGIGFGAVTWGLPLLLVHLVRPAGLGFGDVKAAGVIGATLGLTQHVAAIASLLVAAIAIAVLAARHSRRGEVALGPFLAGAAGTGLVAASLARVAA